MAKNEKSQEQLSEVIFSWKYPEYIKYKKNIWWYVGSVIVLAAVVVWLFFVKNYLFAIFLILFYLIVLMYENREPEIIDFFITPDGVKTGRSFHYYKALDHFYIIYEDHGIKNLYLEFKNSLLGRLIIPLDGQDAVAIREYLLQFLIEDLEREAEPLSEQLRRLLKL
ncbi:MAG: hypothetical protein WC516_00320 [Patescibacteria group bacterium]